MRALSKLIPWCLIIAGLLPAALPARAAEPPPDVTAVVGKIEAAYQKINDLQSDFIQVTQYEGFPSPAVSKGRLSIRRPGKMRWDYREPSKHQIYVNDHEVIYMVPEHQQAIRSSMDREVRSPVPLMLLAGAANLSEQFTLAWEGPPGEHDGRYRIRLTGKADAAAIAPLAIEADAKEFLIRKVVLHDPSGAQTAFEFTNVKLNSGIKDDVFTFTAPEGVDVVDAPPLMPQGHEPKGEIK